MGRGKVRSVGASIGVLGLIAALVATLCVTGVASAASTGPQRLTVDGMTSPVGLGIGDVYFGWQVVDSRRGATQAAYRIVVSRPVLGGVGRGSAPVVWDSGPVEGSEQAFVPYRGPGLAPDTTYRWTVQTWDAAGSPGPLAAPSTFDTGLADGDWHADWIKRATVEVTDSSDAFALQSTFGVFLNKDEYTYARKEAVVGHSPVVRARAYISADQQYELYVNGSLAGKGQAYQYPDSQYYETQDITGLVRSGRANAFGLIYNWQGPAKGRPEGTPGLIARISILHADGSTEVITTDGTWRVLPGAWLPGTQRDEEGDPVDYTENINGPAEPVGWDRPGFLDAAWAPATVIGLHPTAPWTHLVPVRTRIAYEPVPAVSITRLASGAVVADFGRVYAAIPSVAFHTGVPGHVVTMHAGDLLNPSTGEVSTSTGTQHTDMSYAYVERGLGETFRPFDYLAFRYLQIDDPIETLTTHDVVAISRHTAVPDEHAGVFSSSDPTVDAVFALGRHSALFTMQEQFVDTPTREKGPWLGDGRNESLTAMDAFGESNLTRKDLLEFGQSQARYWPDGEINKIYPTALGAQEIPQGTEYYPDWVWQYWVHTGDRALLETLYPVTVKVSDFLWRNVGHSGLIGTIPGPTDVPSFPTDAQINLLAVNVFHRVGDMAAALGRPRGEITAQGQRAASLTAAINTHLLLAAGHYTDGLDAAGHPVPDSATVCTCSGAISSQVTNALAIEFGVVPPPQRSSVTSYVVGQGMAAPVVYGGTLLDALGIAGRDDASLRILTDAKHPGWANILARGATFGWEMWDPVDTDFPVAPFASFFGNGDSMSHGFGSNVLVSIQQTMLGVVPTAPGFAAFDVTPPLHALEHAAGTVPTPRGQIAVSWNRPQRPGAPFRLDVSVPPNATATIRIPASDVGAVRESGTPLDQATGVASARLDGAYVAVTVGSGLYHLTSTRVPAGAMSSAGAGAPASSPSKPGARSAALALDRSGALGRTRPAAWTGRGGVLLLLVLSGCAVGLAVLRARRVVGHRFRGRSAPDSA